MLVSGDFGRGNDSSIGVEDGSDMAAPLLAILNLDLML
jgi:hypothetical protein